MVGRAVGRPDPIARALVAWFRRHRRPLPWRADRDPYRIWVAEVLLQQTRVAQAVPYFERFVRQFPDLRTLARARPQAVLKAWAGAGYYARARHLHAAARRIVVERGGAIPDSVEELERLPGVGPYIARAVASLAFGRPVAAVEANGFRVAARWSGERAPLSAPGVRARLAGQLAARLPPDRAGEFNEAVMELGETVCRPVAPDCPRCPVRFGCRAGRGDVDPGTIPTRLPPRPRPVVRAAVLAVEDAAGRWLVQRRPPEGLLGGLWEFPGGKIERGERPAAAARRELREETGLTVGTLTDLGEVVHAYSHFGVRLRLFRGSIPRRGPPLRRGAHRWLPLGAIRRLALPRATTKLLDRLSADTTSPGSGSRPGRSTASPRRASRPRRRRARVRRTAA